MQLAFLFIFFAVGPIRILHKRTFAQNTPWARRSPPQITQLVIHLNN
jgi:hypothetical protein